MPHSAARIAAVLLILAGVLSLAAFPTLTSAPHVRSAGLRTDSTGVDWLNVSTSDSLVFATSISEVYPGDQVHVVVTQLGSVVHTFTLSPTAGYQFPTTDTSSDLKAYFSTHTPLVDIPVGTATGGKYYGNFTAPPLGQYEYVCTEAGHFPSMSGLLGSGEAGGTVSTNNGAGAPVFIISGTIVGLVILALVLGFVVGKRRGSHDEMPPERLGYPEPAKGAEPPSAP